MADIKGERFGEYGRTDIRRYVERGGATTRSIVGRVLLVILLIILLTLAYFAWSWATSATGQRSLTDAKNWVVEHSPWTWYQKNILDRAVNIGGVWTAEENKTSQLKGVLFNAFSVIGDLEVPLGQQVSLAYDLTVSNTEVFELPLRMECNMLNEETKATILPDSTVKFSGTIPPDVTCVFDTTQINLTKERETRQIDGKVTFPFKTEDATLPVYFIGEQTYKELKGKDFFKVYNLDVPQPIRVVYNGEPVEIGLGASRKDVQPVVVSATKQMVGVRLKNKWKGSVKNVTEIVLWLPKGVTIDSGLSKNPSNLCPFVHQGIDGDYNKYSLSSEYKNKITIQMPQGKESSILRPPEEKTFECWLEISDDVLAGSLYSLKNYKATVDYVYELPKKTATVTLVNVNFAGGANNAQQQGGAAQ